MELQLPSSPRMFRPAGQVDRAQQNREYDDRRGSASSRGYNHRWAKARKTYLLSHPLCVMCEKKGLIVASKVVDHRTPHRGDQVLFWDVEGNWQALCEPCHNSDKQRQDRAYGKAK